MIKLRRLRLVILPAGTIDNTEKYGFDIPFYSGLNIIAGQNSRGKSTIGSSIYYALGMEELLELGAMNEKALGKALKTEFETTDPVTGDIIAHRVSRSRIALEIENDRGEIATIVRLINSGEFDKSGDLRTKKARVFRSSIADITNETEVQALFIRNYNNNTDEYGFYHWLAEFIGLDLPEVVNSKGRSPLYLQSIFSALLIEQTKGWSEFLATMPFYGINRAKEKVIEFLLNLKELAISTERDDIEREETRLTKKWEQTVARLDGLAAELNGHVRELPENVTPDQDSLKIVALMVRDEEEQRERTLKSLLGKQETKLSELMQLPVKKVGENKEHIREKLEILYGQQIDFMKQYEEFDTTLNLQKSQHENITKHLGNVSRELVAQKGIKNVIEESKLITDVFDQCPTCHQTVSDDLMKAEGVTIEKYTLDQNISYLSGQQGMMKSSINSLRTIIDEKELMRKYYLNKQRKLEEEIKVILRELIEDDRDYSDVDSLNRVRLEKEVNDLRYAEMRFDRYILGLGEIAAEYQVLLIKKGKLETRVAEDRKTLTDFESIFKNQYLFPMGYDSNQAYNIFIQLNEPFKYFPVFKFNSESELPQSIKTNSSASDFVRTMWAYSLSLLVAGKNHPGLLLLDEPGQHSIRSQNLQTLFEKAAAIKNRQVIILTSVQKVLITENDKPIDKLDLDALLSKLIVNEDYHIFRLPNDGKSIVRLS
ncbi:coiled-coil domain-containing protein [Mucilaginibacter ginsenosidivorax]|uniref:Uncharacterized protein n=1 Tax=Mucilaginibacter ginsenosidivorax TaxID=862126 RepID=A0A5B8VZ24_9SPHI|nr:hypothetical protein [Mucilaginibacter ginsenosidivorax]QEC76910.1 hypothetical protein FSB76_13505 [Mucilaginibacter ginsenosidivorax]